MTALTILGIIAFGVTAALGYTEDRTGKHG